MRNALGLIFFTFFSCGISDDRQVDKKDTAIIPSAFSLEGSPFFPPQLSEERSAFLSAQLDSARVNWETNPSEQTYIWYGRRLAYLSKYTEAIDIYSKGIELFPDSYKLYRHRGHRYITLRKFEQAVDDLHRAAQLIGQRDIEIEADGMPNALNIPLSNTQFNIFYHLGLSHYLMGNWTEALNAYRECMKYSGNDDLVTATSDWLYMTYVKLGDQENARAILETISEEMEIIENDSYYNRLLMYKGLLVPDDLIGDTNELSELDLATQGYGLGNYYISSGDTIAGTRILKKVIAGNNWAAFGYIAAESDLLRLSKKVKN